MSRHHILHILGNAQPESAGIISIVEGIATGLDPEKFGFHVWFLEGDGPLAAELERHGLIVRTLVWRNGLRDPLGMGRFAMMLREQPFAIVHQHYGGRALRWATRFRQSSRILVHLHGRVLENRGGRLIDPRIYAADLAIATSSAVAKRVKNIPVKVVYPGIPVVLPLRERNVEPDPSNLVLGTAARLVPLKGIVHLIRAVFLLHLEIPRIRLEIAGSGPEEAALREEVRKLGLTDHVCFLGWQSTLAPLFERWDVFVLPSLEEAFGMALTEAMAAGLPVISTNVGGIPEIVANGETGWLVPPADPVALSEYIAKLLADPGERKRMGMAGRARVLAKFSRESMVSAIGEIYDGLLKARPTNV